MFPKNHSQRCAYIDNYAMNAFNSNVPNNVSQEIVRMRLAHTNSSGIDWVSIYFRSALNDNKLIDQTSIRLEGNYHANLEQAKEWFSRKWPNAKNYIVCFE